MSRDTEKDLEICEKATPGPWEHTEPHWHKGCSGKDCKQSVYSVGRATVAVAFGAQYRLIDYSKKPSKTIDKKINSPDAVFIATAREALPYYINAYKEALAENAVMQEALERALKWIGYNPVWIGFDEALSSTAGKDFLTERDTLRAEVERLRGAIKRIDELLLDVFVPDDEDWVRYTEACIIAQSILEGDGK